MHRIAIIGSGPTAIYCAHALMDSAQPLHVTVFEKTGSAGTGMPYRLGTNSPALLANIASIELPPLLETLEKWLQSRSDSGLDAIGVDRDEVDDRAFFPRVTLGSYFRDQLFRIVEMAPTRGHRIDIRTHHEVRDVRTVDGGILVDGRADDELGFADLFDHVVVATGHTVGDPAQTDPSRFDSPYPTSRLAGLAPCKVAILGTSLSGIDATIAIAMDHGAFVETDDGLAYRLNTGSDTLSLTMMSRSGILPEADFYCPIPYEPLPLFTEDALNDVIEGGSDGLLDRAMGLFKEQLADSDPDYAKQVDLDSLTSDTFAKAYFAPRRTTDPFVWARKNLREVAANRAAEHTVPWRYAILRMHETMELVVSNLSEDDRKRFDKGLKKVFIDNYAAIPPQSLERLIALRDASVLSIDRLGSDYTLTSAPGDHVVTTDDETQSFSVLIDATGEVAMTTDNLPFASLRAPFARKQAEMTKEPEADGDDEAFPEALTVGEIYMASLPYMMTDRPFVQGLVSCHEVGVQIAQTITAKVAAEAEHAAPDLDQMLDDLIDSPPVEAAA